MFNKLLSKLRKNEPTKGTWLQIGSPISAGIMASVGFDWICVDLEHGSIGIETMTNMFMAIENRGGAIPIARVPSDDPTFIHRVLDAGARGIVVPMVMNDVQCGNAVRCAKYPPQGHRGYGYCRANCYGEDFDWYSKYANDNIAVIAQIEHVIAIENLWPILQVEGLDATFIGPYDLSGSLGCSGNFTNPDYLKALDTYVTLSKQAGVPMGTHVVHPNRDRLKDAIDTGYSMIAIGMDSTLLRCATDNAVGEFWSIMNKIEDEKETS